MYIAVPCILYAQFATLNEMPIMSVATLHYLVETYLWLDKLNMRAKHSGYFGIYNSSVACPHTDLSFDPLSGEGLGISS